MRIRVKVSLYNEAWSVDLPTYQMVNGSFLPIIEGLIDEEGVLTEADPHDRRLKGLTCLVDVPDAYANGDGTAVDMDKLREIHRGHKRWDNDIRQRSIETRKEDLPW